MQPKITIQIGHFDNFDSFGSVLMDKRFKGSINFIAEDEKLDKIWEINPLLVIRF